MWLLKQTYAYLVILTVFLRCAAQDIQIPTPIPVPDISQDSAVVINDSSDQVITDLESDIDAAQNIKIPTPIPVQDIPQDSVAVTNDSSNQVITDLESDIGDSFTAVYSEESRIDDIEDYDDALDSWLSPNVSRVIGGQLVREVVPFQISMQLFRRGKWSHFCGGSIIGPYHAVTAAHCVHNIKIEDASITCGTLNWQNGGDRHKIVAKRVHPNFSMSSRIINDIAVVKVTPPFNLRSRNVGAISLGGTGRVGNNVDVRLTGWGSTTPTASNGLPDSLQMLNYKTISNEECGAKGFKVTYNEICALAQIGKGACVGDSGGPLVTTQGVPQLVGIVSYGTATCAQGRPDVYTRVSSFLAYINKVITTEIP